MDSLTVVVMAVVLVALASAIGYWAGAHAGQLRNAALQGQCDALSAQLQTRGTLDATLQPLQRAMSDLAKNVQQAENSRTGEISGLSERVLAVGRQVAEATKDVGQQAARITEALSRTHHQGSWGEMQLRRLVEASGMLAHVHFTEQTTVNDEDRWLRPDMIIDLGQGRQVVVDAKVSLDAFLNPELDEQQAAEMHAAAVSDHVTRLAGKQYWKAVGTPEFVIMFLPAEHLLAVALQTRPDLLQWSFDRKVVLATPTTLMATLRSVSWAWQQAAMADQARDVLLAGQTVAQRLATMTDHVAKMGKSLDDAVTGYNRFIGSLDSRVMPAARRLGDLVAPDGPAPTLSEIDVRARQSTVVVQSHDDGQTLQDTG